MGPADLLAHYLTQLRQELTSVDPALAHDAMIDAETHLRAAIASGKSPAQAIEDFGSAAEYARGYVDAAGPMRTIAPPLPTTLYAASREPASGSASAETNAELAPQGGWASRIPVIGIWFQAHAWLSLVYFLFPCFLTATAAFIWVVTVGSLAIGLLPIFVGIPLFVLLLGSARALGLAQGKVVEWFLGVRMPRRIQPMSPPAPGDIGLWTRVVCWLKDVRSWLSLGYLFGNFFVATALFTVFVTLTALTFGLLAMAIGAALNTPIDFSGSSGTLDVNILGHNFAPDANGQFNIPMWLSLLVAFIGFISATATLWIARGTGWIYGQVVQAIQVARPKAVA